VFGRDSVPQNHAPELLPYHPKAEQEVDRPRPDKVEPRHLPPQPRILSGPDEKRDLTHAVKTDARHELEVLLCIVQKNCTMQEVAPVVEQREAHRQFRTVERPVGEAQMTVPTFRSNVAASAWSDRAGSTKVSALPGSAGHFPRVGVHHPFRPSARSPRSQVAVPEHGAVAPNESHEPEAGQQSVEDGDKPGQRNQRGRWREDKIFRFTLEIRNDQVHHYTNC